MATEVSSIFVRIGARTQEFEKRMASVRRSIRKIGKQAMGLGVAFAGGAVVAASALGVIARKSQLAIDAMGKLSTRFDIPVEKLSSFKFAVEAAGTSLEKVVPSLGKMRDFIGDAARGTGVAVDAMEQLGISTADLAKVQNKPLQQFYLFIDALGDIADESLRASLGREVFGRAYDELVPIIKNGTDEMRKAQKVFEALGATLDDKLTKSTERVNDRFALYGNLMDLFTQQVVSNYSPMLERLGTAFDMIFAKTVLAHGGMDAIANLVAGKFIDGIIVAIQKLREFANGLNVTFTIASDLLDVIGERIGAVAAGFAAIGRGEVQAGFQTLFTAPSNDFSDSSGAVKALIENKREAERQTEILREIANKSGVGLAG